MLFNTRLAAQCTDARVNIVADALYKRFPTLRAIADAKLSDMEETVKPCGFYHNKARDLINGARLLIDNYGGRVPDTMEELLKLPGIGRKTANVVLGELFGKPSIAADTHCIRLSNRLGLCDTKDPVKVENILKQTIPGEEQTAFCHRLIAHGRAVCKARKPDCAKCGLRDICATA
jgi:endonuclease-3